MARQDIPLSEALRDSNPKINQNFTELYTGKEKTDRLPDIETSQRVVYVSPAGSDSTGDGSSGNRWATIQHAVDQARTMMQPANSTTAYKIVCATGTYQETITIPPNLLGAFNALGRGGVWVTSETGVKEDVLIESDHPSRAILCYGSASIDSVTIANDSKAIEASGNIAVTVFAYNCVLRRVSASDGGQAAIQSNTSNVISRTNSSVTGQRFAYGLDATYGALIAKAQEQPSGATANERMVNGGVIR